MAVTVEYQVQYEACALLFLIILACRFFSMRRFPDGLNKLFGAVLLLSVADLALDIAGAYTIMYAALTPVWANYLVNTAFYAMQVLLPALMTSYVLLCAGKRYADEPRRLLLLIPAAACILMLLTNPLTDWVFHLPVIDGVRRYARGRYFNLFYLGTGFYLGATVALVYIYREKLSRQQRLIIVGFILIVAAAMLVQFVFPGYLLTGVAVALAIQMMFFTLQNPEDMLDVISGAFNYNAMMIYLDAVIRRKGALWLAAVDVGGVRRVNSAFGLSAGNQVIREVGSFLSGIGGGVWAFRMMGTRFLLVAPGEAWLHRTLSAVGERFDRPWPAGEDSVYLSATIRYFDNACPLDTSEEIVTLVDAAYSETYASGWGPRRRIGPELLRLSRRRSQVEDAVRDALSSGRGFSLCYQPIYHAKRDGFCWAEALLRLDDPVLGRISPAEFIPIAEKSGLILRVDELVIRMACQFLSRSRKPERLEINLSAAEFFRNPAQRIHTLARSLNADPSRICFEVTETATASRQSMLTEFMQDMMSLGYSFALDDFGTGYANISQIAQLPFSVAKLDRTLVTGEAKGRILLEAVIGMFMRLGIDTVAEGVEDGETAERAIGHGATCIQGYYYAKPMTERELTEFFESKKEDSATSPPQSVKKPRVGLVNIAPMGECEGAKPASR